MNSHMSVKYDEISDTLYIDACPRYREQESDEIAPGVVARFNPTSGAIESIDLMFFRERFDEGKEIDLPVSVDMRAARSA